MNDDPNLVTPHVVNGDPAFGGTGPGTGTGALEPPAGSSGLAQPPPASPYGQAAGIHGSSPADLIEFIESVITSGPIDLIVVYQEHLEGKQKLRSLAVKAIDTVALSEDLSKLVMNWTSNRGRRTTFLLEAYAGAELRGSHSIVRDVQPVLGSTLANGNEPPTEAGVLAMTMRHQEAIMRTTHVMQDANAGWLTRALVRAEQRIIFLENREQATAAREAQNRVNQVDTAFQHEQNRLKLHIQAQVFGALVQALPSIVAKFTANVVVEKFRSFASELTLEQQGMIATALSDKQRAQLGELFQALAPPQLPGQVTQALAAGTPPAEPAPPATGGQVPPQAG